MPPNIVDAQIENDGQEQIENDSQEQTDEEKHVLPPVQLNGSDQLAFGELLETDEVDENTEGDAANGERDGQGGAHSTNDTMASNQVKTTVTVMVEDEAIEMTYVVGERLRPQMICVKVNDPLSGNLPYQENVRFKVAIFKST